MSARARRYGAVRAVPAPDATTKGSVNASDKSKRGVVIKLVRDERTGALLRGD